MIESASGIGTPSTSLSDDDEFSTAMSPYTPLVVWPQEYTRSLEKAAVKEAFRKTYNKIRQAGCNLLLLEPAVTPGRFFFSFLELVLVIILFRI